MAVDCAPPTSGEGVASVPVPNPGTAGPGSARDGTSSVAILGEGVSSVAAARAARSVRSSVSSLVGVVAGTFASLSAASWSWAAVARPIAVGSVTGDRYLYLVSLLSGADGAVLGGVGGAWPYWVSHFASASAALNDPMYSEFALAPL